DYYCAIGHSSGDYIL
nr:immunoglobulin light chain junction region [Macaca mulatta]